MVADEMIDSLQFYWNRSYTMGPWTRNGPRIKSCPPQLHLLEDALTLQYWEIHLELWIALIAKNLSSAPGAGTLEFHHTKELVKENDPANEIVISDQFGEIHISNEAFERLMSRYFEVILAGAPKYKQKWLGSRKRWWRQFVKVARLLQEKINRKNGIVFACA